MRRNVLELANPQARNLTAEELSNYSTILVTSGAATSIVMPAIPGWATNPEVEIFNGGSDDLTLTGNVFWHGAPLANTASAVVKSGEWCRVFWYGPRQAFMVMAAVVLAPAV